MAAVTDCATLSRNEVSRGRASRWAFKKEAYQSRYAGRCIIYMPPFVETNKLESATGGRTEIFREVVCECLNPDLNVLRDEKLCLATLVLFERMQFTDEDAAAWGKNA